MSIGPALLRPQGLTKPPVHGPSRAFDLVVEFIETLVKDPEGTKAIAEALGQSGAEVLPAFLLSRQEPLRLAEGKLRQLFRPFSSVVQDFVSELKEGIAEALPAVLKGLRRAIALLRTDSATHMLRELLHIARTDLDLTSESVEGLFRHFIEGAVTRLQARVVGGDLSEEALAHYELGVSLRNLEHLILEERDWPTLDLDVMVDALVKLYTRTGFDELLRKLALVLEAAESVAGPLGLLIQTAVTAKVSVGGSVGAAAAGPSPDPADLPPGPDPLCWYASWMIQKNVYAPKVEPDHTDISPIEYIAFQKVGPYAMEQVAFHSAWAVDVVDFLLHFISAEQGDMATNILNDFWDLCDFMFIVAGPKRIPTWVHWLMTPGISLLGGLERTRCSGGDDVLYPLTLLLGDLGEVMLYKRWTWLMREFLLSTMTLANHNPAKLERWESDGRPAETTTQRENRLEKWPVKFNHNQFHGFCYGFGEIGAIILPAILSETDRLNYGFDGGGPPPSMIGKAFGGLAISWPMTWLSLMLARVTSGQWADDTVGMVLLPLRERTFEHPTDSGTAVFTRILFDTLFAVIEFAQQVIYLYLFTNGNTSGGKFSGLVGGPEAEFPGFPDNPEGSPYKLPWAGGDMKECVQNPMGIWSHFPLDFGQTYAYDFNHDGGNEVVCSREGLIMGIIQNQINHNKQSWNRIEVLSLRILAADAPGAMPAVPPPTAPAVPVALDRSKYTDTTLPSIEPGTLFPPYWDVNGNSWPLLPPSVAPTAATPTPTFNLPLHPSGAILPAGSALSGGIPAGKFFAFSDPAYDRGLQGIVYPPGAKFSDGQAIPVGLVFAPGTPNPPTPDTPMYRPGTTFAPIKGSFTASPIPTGILFGTAGVTPAAGAKFLDGVAIPSGVIMPPDCGATPAWLPLPHPATPLYLPGTLFLQYTAGPFFNAGTAFVPMSMPFPSIPPTPPGGTAPSITFAWMTPLVFTMVEYGHGLQNFTRINAGPPATGQPDGPLTDVFPTNKINQLLGLHVPQGRVVMLSGDTGVSAYNHLHTHVIMDSSTNSRAIFTIPFAYADAKHGIQHGFREAPSKNGVPHAMTWYTSENTRTGP